MRSSRLALATLVFALLASCGQPNASDTPGAAPVSAGSPATQASAQPSPEPIATAAAVTTPCTKGNTETTPNGVRIVDSKCGSGKEATRGSAIKVKYVGKLATGKIFDSTANHGGKPYQTRIAVGAVIPGWDEGVPGMRVGGVRHLLIPPTMAYGSTGAGAIPPNATIEFTIKLVGVTAGA
jgi:FK506-binding nuclear protein